MEALRRIMIGKKTYPFRIDLNVLEHIQEEYGSINKFERELAGIEFKKDAEGRQVYSAEGDPVVIRTETSIRAIKTVLPAAVNEGLAIQADEEGHARERVEGEYIFRNCTIPFDILGKMLHEEFRRCFETKK